MRKKLYFWLFIVAAVASFSTGALAWDDAGHKVSANIAWRQMTTEVQEKVFKILLNSPEDSDLNVYYNAFDSRSDEVKRLELFMFASTWADNVRNPAFKVRFANYNKAVWHYGDIFWKQENGNAEILKDFPVESGKAISKLYDFEKILRDANAPDSEKAIALAWFLHVGGDIHNPLHNASRVTELEPEGDQGGNMFLLTPKDAQRRTNLHSFWDSLITKNMPRNGDECDSDYVSDTALKITGMFPYSSMQDRIKAGEFIEWSNEGFLLLNSKVYAADLKRGEMPSDGYNKSSFAIGQEQIALAGYRLGVMLNMIFGSGDEMKVAGKTAGCKVIRNILYPVKKRKSPDQQMKIAVLDICPENKGLVARPVISIVVGGKQVHFEFDVVKVFESEAEARQYSSAHNITDAKYN